LEYSNEVDQHHENDSVDGASSIRSNARHLFQESVMSKSSDDKGRRGYIPADWLDWPIPVFGHSTRGATVEQQSPEMTDEEQIALFALVVRLDDATREAVQALLSPSMLPRMVRELLTARRVQVGPTMLTLMVVRVADELYRTVHAAGNVFDVTQEAHHDGK
jgi:hypothetical protein